MSSRDDGRRELHQVDGVISASDMYKADRNEKG